MFHSDPVIVGLTAVGVGVPVATLLGWLPRRRSRTASPSADERTDSWSLSHKIGNVFLLTNLTGQPASDVELTSASADVDVLPRGAPWPKVDAGGTVEFVATSTSGAGSISISWKADGEAASTVTVAFSARGK